MGKDYLVEGARLMCIQGGIQTSLRVPMGHGYTSNGKKKANCGDCLANANIKCFGSCKKNEKTHLCEGYMLLAKKWENIAPSANFPELINGKEAITMDSVLICKKGGLIVPVTSGQGYEPGLNMTSYLKRYLNLLTWAKGRNLLCHVFGKDPINMNTGNFIYEKEDLVIPGIRPLSFKMFYNAMEEGKGLTLGEGWHHNHEQRLNIENQQTITLCQGDGREIPYRRRIGDLYSPVFGDKGLLKKEGNGYRYCSATEEESYFDETGRLTAVIDKNGNRDTYSYNETGLLEKITGANGGTLTYYYNKEQKLIQVNDHTGREIRIWYRYGKLWKFINVSGHTYTYAYNANGKLESVLTPRGIRGFFNEYDGVDRVLKQTLPDGGVAEFRYDDENLRTYMLEQNGNLIWYQSDERSRNIKTVCSDGEERYEYNDKNQRTRYIDKNGNKTTYRYDDNGNLTGITNALGETIQITRDEAGRPLTLSLGGKVRKKNRYDTTGRLTEMEDALGRERKFIYDERGLPKQILLPDQSNYLLTHDANGNIQSITNPYGGTVTYTYDSLNRVTASTDTEGNNSFYTYDEANRLLSVTNPAGNTRTYTYNESGKPVTIKDYDGGIIAISYDAMNRPEEFTDKEGRKTKHHYDWMGNLQEETAPTGAVITYQYDKNSRLQQVEIKKEKEGEASTLITYTYDLAGNLVEKHTGNENTILSSTAYTYDPLNRVTQSIDPAGGIITYTYDDMGNKTKITDQMGNTKHFTYNEAGELTEETDIRGNKTSYTYNKLSKVAAVTTPAGTIRYHYQPGGLLEKEEHPDGKSVSYTYDSAGKIKTKTDQNGYCLTYHYDVMGRIKQVASSKGQVKTYAYDAMGNLISITDANGNTTNYEYTMSGRLRTVTDPLSNRTQYLYDEGDKLIHICRKGTNGETKRSTSYQRDVFGYPECITDDLGGEEHYVHDALGRIIQKTDKEGYETAYTYTPDGHLSGALYGDGTQTTLEYTPLRQLTLIKDWLGETRIERNQTGDPIRIIDPEERIVSYEWGSCGERRKTIYPDGKEAIYRYDDHLRLTQLDAVKDGKNTSQIRYRYDKEGRLAQKQQPGDISTQWSYNQEGQPEELLHKKGELTLDRYRYHYDAMGNKVQIERERSGLPGESGGYRFDYDALNRLSQVEKDGTILREYTYDSFGNRSEMQDHEKGRIYAYTYNTLDQLLTEESWAVEAPGQKQQKTYTYDKRGNMTAEYQGEELRHGYTYSAMNRLATAWNDNGAQTQYRYNGLGQRVGSNEEEYLLDLTKPYHNLLEIQGNKGKQSFYWDKNAAIMVDERQDNRYFLNDEMGSPVRLLYSNGNGKAYGYDEFGMELYEEAEKGSGERYTKQGREQPFGYTGYRYDEISGTYFAQAREYRPELGRFMAEDALKNRSNWYLYCECNPMIYVDLSGLESYVFYTTEKNSDFSAQAEWKKNELESKGEEVVMIPVAGVDDFLEGWENLGLKDGAEVNVNNVEIYTHGQSNGFIFVNGSSDEAINIKGENSKKNSIPKIEDLPEKEIDELNIYSCNAGNYLIYMNKGQNLASEISKRVKNGVVYAYDGNVSFGTPIWKFWEKSSGYDDRLSTNQDSFNNIRSAYKSHLKPKGKLAYIDGEYMKYGYYNNTYISGGECIVD